MRPWTVMILAALLAAWSARQAVAQSIRSTKSDPSTSTPSTGLGVQLFTMGPGEAIWEKFGHNAIAVIDHQSGDNRAYNYGVFDFNERDFLLRFIRGDMRYWMEPADTIDMVGPYIQLRRDVFGQELLLSQTQASALLRHLETNALPENRYYRYDYYADNCSTRIRDAIDIGTGGQVKRQLQSIRTGRTFRQHTRIGMASSTLLGVAVDYATGPYVDRELNAWEESFLPEQLMRHLRAVTIDRGDGSRGPLVGRDRVISASDRPEFRLPERPPARAAWMGLIGLIVGTIMALTGWTAARSRRGRWLAAALWGGWGLLAGIGGWFLLFVWLLTNHRAAYANENLLQTSPLAMALVVLGPLAAFGRAEKINGGVVGACAVMALAGVMLKLFPGSVQQNQPILALSLPIWIGMALGVWRRGRRSVHVNSQEV